MPKEKTDRVLIGLIGAFGALLLVTQICSGILLARTDLSGMVYWVWGSLFH